MSNIGRKDEEEEVGLRRAEVRGAGTQGEANAHRTVSSQVVGPLPHLGPEGGQVPMRDEETALSNPAETDGGLRRKAGWAAGAVGLGARRPHFLSVEGLGAGLLGRRRGKGPDFLVFKPLRLRVGPGLL